MYNKNVKEKPQMLMGLWFGENAQNHYQQIIVTGKNVKDIITKVIHQTKRAGVIQIYLTNELREILDFKKSIRIINHLELDPQSSN